MTASTESFLNGRVTLHCGDCLEVLATLPECSVDSVVTDPPYHLTSIVKRFGKVAGNFGNGYGSGWKPDDAGLGGAFARTSRGFMGRIWDGGDIAFRPETWAEVLRVLKPGGHLLAFGGTRTSHRVACAIEDAGFEIRDTIMWVYGTGFPKSHDVSKGIDRAAGAEREIVGPKIYADGHIQNNTLPSANFAPGGQYRWGDEHYSWESLPDTGKNFHMQKIGIVQDTAPATEAAKQWEGWGTALKPAIELIVLARKPLSEGTVAANVLRWGTGAINVGACRVATNDTWATKAHVIKGSILTHETAENASSRADSMMRFKPDQQSHELGRWPANLIHDGSEEVVGAFPETHAAGTCSERADRGPFNAGTAPLQRKAIPNDSGSAARFFYSAKADGDDRLGSKHPTVKPLDLMQYLVRLVTPKSVNYCPQCEGCHAIENKETSSPASVQRMWDDLSSEGQPTRGQILQSAMCGESSRSETGAVPMVRDDISAAQGWGADVLQQDMFKSGSGEKAEINSGLCDEQGGIQAPSHADASSIPCTSGLHLRAPLGNGTKDRTDVDQERSRPSHQWNQGRQSAREFATDVEGRPRQTESSAPEHSELSALCGENRDKPTCPYCGTEFRVRPGTVLDPFSGTGTTGEAAWREGMRAILIEAETEYQADVRRRMALALAGPDEKAHAIVKAKGLTETPGPLFDWGGEYNAQADIEGSFNEAYSAIRQRKAAGGPGWEPK